ncbi:glycosyltransferase family 2 protein [Planctomycetota bacterium]
MNISTLAVCMPVYNERDTIGEIVEKVLAVDVPLEIRLYITDDCSTDGTDEVLRKLAEAHPGRIFVERQERNLGKGAAVNNCLGRADGDVLLIQDADLEYDPDEYPKLLEPIMKGEADVVFGSRFTDGRPEGAAKVLYLGNRALTLAFNVIHGVWLTDMETCYKVFRKEVVRSIKIWSKRFGIEPEISAKIKRQGYRIVEVPISYHPRSYEEGKKIGLRDGIKALAAIVWFRFFD